MAILLLGSCRDRHQDEDTLPPATQEGKNTGGALVDGKVWVAKIEAPDSNPGGNNTIYKDVNGENSITIVLRKVGVPVSNQMQINVTTTEELAVKTYNFFDVNQNRAAFYISPNTYFTEVGIPNGTLKITRFDKVNNIVSGTFSFTAKNSSGQQIKVTEGRFDRKFFK